MGAIRISVPIVAAPRRPPAAARRRRRHFARRWQVTSRTIAIGEPLHEPPSGYSGGARVQIPGEGWQQLPMHRRADQLGPGTFLKKII
jgi:hypothetical protein